VGTLEVAITLIGFTLLYGGLAVVEVGLLAKRIRGDVADGLPGDGAGAASTDLPSPFAY
jgi:hypothetical protein